MIHKNASQRLPFLDVILSPRNNASKPIQQSNSDSSHRNSSSESAEGDLGESENDDSSGDEAMEE